MTTEQNWTVAFLNAKTGQRITIETKATGKNQAIHDAAEAMTNTGPDGTWEVVDVACNGTPN